VVQRSAKAHLLSEGASTTFEVTVDRATAEWTAADTDGSLRSGTGRILPVEAAVLMPQMLPMWGRPEDSYSPILAEPTDHGILITARHREHAEATCGVVLDTRLQVATAFVSPNETVRVLEPFGN